MTLRQSFPDFDDPKLSQFAEILEQQFALGPYRQRRQAVVNSGTYNIAGVDEVVHVDYTATGAVQINLPKISLFTGRALVVNDRGANAATNNITFVDAVAGTVYTVSADSECVTIASDGSSWYIESKNG